MALYTTIDLAMGIRSKPHCLTEGSQIFTSQ